MKKKSLISAFIVACMVFSTTCAYAQNLVSSTPLDGAVGVEVTSSLDMNFDSAVDPSTLTKANVTVNGRTDIVSGFEHKETAPNSFTTKFHPLDESTRYRVDVDGVKVGTVPTKQTVKFTTGFKKPTILKGWEFDDESFLNWGSGYTDFSVNNGKLHVNYPQGSEAFMYFNGANGINTKAARKIVFSIKANKDTDVKFYFTTTNDNNFSEKKKFYVPVAQSDEYVQYEIYTCENEFWADTIAQFRFQFWGSSSIDVDSIRIVDGNYPTNKPRHSYDFTNSQDPFTTGKPQGYVNAACEKGVEGLTIKATNWSHVMGDTNGVDENSIGKIVFRIKTQDTFDLYLFCLPQSWNYNKANLKPSCHVTPSNDFVEYTLNVDNNADLPGIFYQYSIATDKAATFTVESMNIYTKSYVDGDFKLGTFEINKGYATPEETNITNTVFETGNISAVLNGVKNNTSSPKSVLIALAAYNKNKLVDIDVKEVALGASETVETPLVATLNVGTNADSLRAFVWDGNMCQLKDKLILGAEDRKRVLILGNSITQHAPAYFADTNVNWQGNWGMAASCREKDYAHVLIKHAQDAGARATFKIENIAVMEANHTNLEAVIAQNMEQMQSCVDFNPDIIIMAIGANVKTDIPQFGTSYSNIINYFNSYGKAQIICVSTLFGQADTWTAISDYAKANSYPYVDNTKYTDYQYLAIPEFGSNPVGWHPGDLGMKVMADNIWEQALKGMLK